MSSRSPRTFHDGDPFRPQHVVWELTTRCDHACGHCGSRAATPRPDELDTPALLEIAPRLVELGAQEVTLIGGEAYLHPGVFDVTRALATAGVRVSLQTGGRGVTLELARRLREAGLSLLGVSVDGPEDAHDLLRSSRGSHRAALAALRNGAEAGLIIAANSQVNRLNFRRLPETLAALRPTGIRAWRAQLTAPMGRAADHPDWILEPYQILEAIDALAAIKLQVAEEGKAQGLPPRSWLDVQISNNLGYFGPHEVVLRSQAGGHARHYAGCVAGLYGLGVESDGKVKGCPSLPSAPYVGGDLRTMDLAQIWEHSPALRFARDRGTDELWGFCKSCMYAEVCRGGCTFTAHTTLGRRGNNPFCYHRAATLRRQGRRERLVQRERAPGEPYDFGRFEIVEEDWSER